MPSFTRRTAPASSGTNTNTNTGPTLPAGLFASPSTSHPLFPTGVPSMDDLLGGGVPAGGQLSIISPDTHSAWGRLMARYFVAQGLASGQDCVILGEAELGKEMVKGCPWLDEGSSSSSGSGVTGERGAGSESEGEGELGAIGQGRGGQRIAWRYESMGKFKTSTGRSSNLNLMKVIPSLVIQQAEIDGSLSYISPGESIKPHALATLEQLRTELDGKGKGKAVRVIVNELGSADWGDYSATDIHRFLHTLRSIIRPRSASALITFPPHMISSPPPSWPSSLEVWLKSISWASDGCIEMRGFADNPSLGPHYAPLHGLLTLHSFPTSHALVPPTMRHSTLLGVSQSATNERGGGGAGENNLGFRVKRKGLVVETAHLGIEGGSGERRTAPADVGSVLDGAGSHTHAHTHTQIQAGSTGGPGQHLESTPVQAEGVDMPAEPTKKPKAKKSVRIAFDEGSLEF